MKINFNPDNTVRIPTGTARTGTAQGVKAAPDSGSVQNKAAIQTGDSFQKNTAAGPELSRTRVFVRGEKDNWWKPAGEQWMKDGKTLEENPFDQGKPGMDGDVKTQAPETLIIHERFTQEPVDSAVPFNSIDTNGEWFIASSKRTQIRDGKLAVQSDNQLQPGGWHSEMKIGPGSLGEMNNRPTVNNYRPKPADDPEVIEMERSSAEQLKNHTYQEQVKGDEKMTPRFLLQERYGDRKNMNIVEIGPYTTTMVARELLKEGSGNNYTAIDIAEAGQKKQKEFLQQAGEYIFSHSKQIHGDLYHMPLESASADLLVSCGGSFPLFAPEKDARDAIDEASRVLKPGGEFVLDTGILELAAAGTLSHLMSKFEITGSHDAGRVVVLRKKTHS